LTGNLGISLTFSKGEQLVLKAGKTFSIETLQKMVKPAAQNHPHTCSQSIFQLPSP